MLTIPQIPDWTAVVHSTIRLLTDWQMVPWSITSHLAGILEIINLYKMLSVWLHQIILIVILESSTHWHKIGVAPKPVWFSLQAQVAIPASQVIRKNGDQGKVSYWDVNCSKAQVFEEYLALLSNSHSLPSLLQHNDAKTPLACSGSTKKKKRVFLGLCGRFDLSSGLSTADRNKTLETGLLCIKTGQGELSG